MSIFEKLIGTMENIFNIGKSNTVSLKNDSGRLSGCNSDNIFREIAPQGISGNDTGYPHSEWKTSTVFSFNVTTRVFSVAPVGDTFYFFVRGKRITKTVAQTVTVPDTTGRYFIYFDESGTLQYSTLMWVIDSPAAPTAILYYNKEKGQYAIFDERHTSSRNISWHAWAHMNIGTLYTNGLIMSGYTLGSTTESSLYLEFTNGEIWDEDLQFKIIHDATPSNPQEQILTNPAQIPVWYRDGANGAWTWDLAGDYFFKNTINGRVNYNNFNGTSWVQQEASDNDFVAYWIYATNNNAPGQSIIAIQGQREDSTLDDAISNNRIDTLNIGEIPSQEFKVLYKIIINTKNNFSNTRKARIVDIEDLRYVRNAGGGEYSPLSHITLAGLNTSGHPGSAITLDTVNFTRELTLSEVNSQLAFNKVEQLFNEKIKTIKLDVGLETVTSTFSVPENAMIKGADLKINTTYSTGTTIEVKTDGVTPLTIMSTLENDPEVVGVYSENKLQSVLSANSGTISAVVSGEPSVGSATLLIYVIESFIA